MLVIEMRRCDKSSRLDVLSSHIIASLQFKLRFSLNNIDPQLFIPAGTGVAMSGRAGCSQLSAGSTSSSATLKGDK